MTPEGKTKARIKKALNECGAKYYMPVQTGYGETQLDFLCTRTDNREFFLIEAKAHKENPTQRQQGIIDHWRAAGFVVFVIDDQDDKLVPKHGSIAKLKEWLTAKP
jgi:hypothetical protein